MNCRRAWALSRRGPALRPQTISIADLTIDTRSRQVWRAGTPAELTANEYALLEYLARHVNRVVRRAEIALGGSGHSQHRIR
jgi:two-component system OmpR family response regulator